MSAHETVTFVLAQAPPPPADPGGQGEDFGKSSPVGLVLLILFGIAVAFLIRSMTKHLKKLPASFETDDAPTAGGSADTGSSATGSSATSRSATGSSNGAGTDRAEQPATFQLAESQPAESSGSEKPNEASDPAESESGAERGASDAQEGSPSGAQERGESTTK